MRKIHVRNTSREALKRGAEASASLASSLTHHWVIGPIIYILLVNYASNANNKTFLQRS